MIECNCLSMVVGGVPVPIGSHAQRIANFALGMRISAKEVMNPVTGEPIQAESN